MGAEAEYNEDQKKVTLIGTFKDEPKTPEFIASNRSKTIRIHYENKHSPGDKCEMDYEGQVYCTVVRTKSTYCVDRGCIKQIATIAYNNEHDSCDDTHPDHITQYVRDARRISRRAFEPTIKNDLKQLAQILFDEYPNRLNKVEVPSYGSDYTYHR
tara:strand:- start:69 stop:536 length:468 start_codon:yes stop_codon:yes gene_type:complete